MKIQKKKLWGGEGGGVGGRWGGGRWGGGGGRGRGQGGCDKELTFL